MPFDIDPKYIEAPTLEPWRQVLLDAAARVRRGWCQRALSDDEGGVCALGALYEVCTGAPEHVPELSNHPEFYRAYDKLNAVMMDSIVGFNNAPGRTAEEVAQAMETAARVKE